jgi:hypothetical protein
MGEMRSECKILFGELGDVGIVCRIILKEVS